MGKAKKKRQRQDQQNNNRPAKRRRKKTGRNHGFWIENCHESTPKQGGPALTVIITQVDLTDDHTIAVGTRTAGEDADIPKQDTPNQHGDKEEEEETPDVGDAKDTNEHGTENPDYKGDKSESEKAADKPTSPSSGVVEEETDSNLAIHPKTPENAKAMGVGSGASPSAPFISIKRAPSANHPPTKFSHQKDFRPLSHGDCGDGIVNPHAGVANKYWAQRKRLFARFDQGIQLDAEGWYSVTPEAIANHIASRVVDASKNERGLIILDAFCGCGGNAIAFARKPEVSLVVCVDLDLNKLQMAANNAKIYEIPSEKLLFIHDNILDVLNGLEKAPIEASPTASDLDGYPLNGVLPSHVDCIFLSPPWGGESYQDIGRSHYDVKSCIRIIGTDEGEEMNGEQLLERAARLQNRIVYFLPRNINGVWLGRSAVSAGYTGTLELEKNVLNGKFKTTTAYLGFGKT